MSRLNAQSAGEVLLGSPGCVRLAIVLGEAAGQPVSFPRVDVFVLVRVEPRQDPLANDGFGAQLQLLVMSTEPAVSARQVGQGLGEVGGVPGGVLGGQVVPQPRSRRASSDASAEAGRLSSAQSRAGAGVGGY